MGPSSEAPKLGLDARSTRSMGLGWFRVASSHPSVHIQVNIFTFAKQGVQDSFMDFRCSQIGWHPPIWMPSSSRMGVGFCSCVGSSWTFLQLSIFA